MFNLKKTILTLNIMEQFKNHIVIYHQYNKSNLLFYISKKNYEIIFETTIVKNTTLKPINLLDRIHTDDIDLFSITKNKSFKLRFRIYNNNKTIIIVKGDFDIYGQDDTKNLFIFKTNLTNVKNLYKNIEDTSVMKRNFQAMMEDTNDFIFFKDTNHVLTASSDSLAVITGYKKGDDIIGKIDYELFSKEHADEYYKLEKEIYNGNIPYIEEIQPFFDENGEEGWVNNRKSPIRDEKGNITGLYGIARVVTKNIKNEQIIDEQKEQLEKAQAVAHLGNWSFDIPTKILLCSDEMYRIFEINKSNNHITQKSFLEKINPEDQNTVKSAYIKSLEDKKGYEIVYRLLLKNEKEKYIQERIAHKFDAKGNIVNLFGTTLDITNLKEYENKIKQKDEIMIAQSRHAAMGEMIAMIAHQWRQPISIISMAANNMLVDIDLDTSNEKSIKEESNLILDQSNHLSKTIDDFRNYFSPTQDKKETTIEDVLQETRDVIDLSLKHNNIELFIKQSFDETVFIHKRELMQVFLNLINNAKDALITNRQTQRKITISVKKETNYLKVLFCDNAGGIEKSIIHEIFNPYFTTKQELNGTGIGLYMSKIIIEKHMKGKLLVQNIKDGVCFSIHLPIVQKEG